MTEGHLDSAAARHGAKLKRALWLTSVYLVLETAAGFWTGSLALLADAGHMLTDVGGLTLALLAINYAGREATREHTFGYYRVEVLAAVLNAVVLLGISAYILIEAYHRFFRPSAVATGWMLVVATIGLVVNIVGMFLLQRGAADSLNLRGAYFEVVSDMVGSIGVIIAAIVIRLTGWMAADPVVSAAIGLFIVPRTWRLLREASDVLLEAVPRDVVGALRESLARLGGVAGVHDLHVWALTSGLNAMSVHVVVSNGESHDCIVRSVEECPSKQFRIGHVTVQTESAGYEQHTTHL